VLESFSVEAKTDRHTCGDVPTVKIQLPSFLYSEQQIEASASYNVLASDYDTYTMTLALAYLYPTQKFESVAFVGVHGVWSSTILMEKYISQTWPCDGQVQKQQI
jgi:hypothetical protein